MLGLLVRNTVAMLTLMNVFILALSVENLFIKKIGMKKFLISTFVQFVKMKMRAKGV